jgi:hypothetical protein
VSGYDVFVSDQPPQTAPELGQPTDARVGDDTAAFLLNGGRPDVDHEDEQTIDTPDELGGTGGEQPGGAG